MKRTPLQCRDDARAKLVQAGDRFQVLLDTTLAEQHRLTGKQLADRAAVYVFKAALGLADAQIQEGRDPSDVISAIDLALLGPILSFVDLPVSAKLVESRVILNRALEHLADAGLHTVRRVRGES